jgi:hypothetical protein
MPAREQEVFAANLERQLRTAANSRCRKPIRGIAGPASNMHSISLPLRKITVAMIEQLGKKFIDMSGGCVIHKESENRETQRYTTAAGACLLRNVHLAPLMCVELPPVWA